ncbi:Inducible metalloproteinase inhibitor protein [Papilio machaon]|uniref:Inducible metalloproteinase inhibitor protein n=1 Tax=Papilio machaon TaxID=76193 RepID=A0A0N0PFQ9_PAPMA|nr:Inducible metalloproteinase inhibitor protein [Papilio machaon]
MCQILPPAEDMYRPLLTLQMSERYWRDKKCTGPNEEYKANKKSCPSEICKSLDMDDECNPEEEGQPGCACKEGYLRKDLNSTCIPLEQCPEFEDYLD